MLFRSIRKAVLNDNCIVTEENYEEELLSASEEKRPMQEKSLEGTQTEKNLWTAFAGESQARNKYNFYAEVARKEGYH